MVNIMVTDTTERDRLIGSIIGGIIAFVIALRFIGMEQWDNFGIGEWIVYIIVQVVVTALGWGLGGLMGEDWNDDGPYGM